ncbi:hypothetical protein [Chromobacterium sphagni]|uniref:hypothetical protein n=1 Tax=Chromobacterium sphagni TaxID=1903179 RepID=UPI0009F2FF4E|nr:hypothetical protein [Chromobacterium sphagni]
MKRKIELIPLNLIKLDQENVRFGGDIAQNQREAINFMMADPDDAKKILKLADHIVTYGLDPTELQLVTPDQDGSYIVLEGNRRLTALKLIQKPDLCPDERLVKGFIAIQKKLNGNLPIEIECSIVSSREAGDIWVELKHTGQNGGVGRVNWDSDIRDERRGRQTGIESIGRQIRNLVKENERIFSKEAVEGVFSIDVTTLTRLFSSTPAQDAFQLKVENKQLVHTLDLKFIAPSVEFAINLFTNEGYNVNDIRSDADRCRFVARIPQDIHPNTLAKAAQMSGNSASSHAENNNTQNGYSKSGQEAENESTSTDGPEVENEINNNTEDNNNSEPPAEKRAKAKPSSRARKYLIPWSLSISNNRINEIYRELRMNLEVETVPNATAVMFRVFIEVSCDDFAHRQRDLGNPIIREDNKKSITDDDKLSAKVKAVAQHLENLNLITKQQSRSLIKRAGTHDSVGSVDHFNQFVHSSATPPIPSELKDIADEYRPMLEAIWKR